MSYYQYGIIKMSPCKYSTTKLKLNFKKYILKSRNTKNLRFGENNLYV